MRTASNDDSRWSGPNSPSYSWEHDPEGHGHSYPKKSVLTKVKERAQRWRQNLGKKKGVDQDGGTPSWGVSLEEDDGEEDADYLGAPSSFRAFSFLLESENACFREGENMLQRFVEYMSPKIKRSIFTGNLMTRNPSWQKFIPACLKFDPMHGLNLISESLPFNLLNR